MKEILSDKKSALIKSEIFRVEAMLLDRNAFKKRSIGFFSDPKLNNIDNNTEMFVRDYFNFLGLYYRSDEDSLSLENYEVLCLKNTYDDILSEVGSSSSFIIQDIPFQFAAIMNRKTPKVTAKPTPFPSEDNMDDIDANLAYIRFLTGHQIGCINRGVKQCMDSFFGIRVHKYDIDAFPLLCSTAIELMVFLGDNPSRSNIGESTKFFGLLGEHIESELTRLKTSSSNGLYNLSAIRSVFKRISSKA
jgi:hypothetical protein